MKGYILISTLSIITILSLIVIFISRSIFQDTVKTSIFNNSIYYRIQLINYEKFLVQSLQNNSNFLRNLDLATYQLEEMLNEKYEDISVNFIDMNTCFNLNSVTKQKENNLIRSENGIQKFKALLNNISFDKNRENEFIDRLVDQIDTNNLPETFGAEDLYYVSNDQLNLTADSLLITKSQLKELNFLTPSEVDKIYKVTCALPDTTIKFNINSLSSTNMVTFLSIFPNLTLNDGAKIISNKPEFGYINLANFMDVNNLDIGDFESDMIIFKPEYLKIIYNFKLNKDSFKLLSFIDLKRREDYLIFRTISE
jgi:type II secretory pathway component PulK